MHARRLRVKFHSVHRGRVHSSSVGAGDQAHDLWGMHTQGRPQGLYGREAAGGPEGKARAARAFPCRSGRMEVLGCYKSWIWVREP